MSKYNGVLLKIRRRFTKDEAFKFMDNELKKAKYENGILKSEVAELSSQLKKANKQLNSPKATLTKDDLKEARFIEMEKRLKAKCEKIKRLTDDVNLWRSMYLNLIAKQNRYGISDTQEP